MTTANEVLDTAALGRCLSQDGVAPHREALEALARTALTLGVKPGAATALLDRTTPEVVCERAFAVVSTALARWSSDHTEPVFVTAA